MLPRPPCPTLFPYTTLFRSVAFLETATREPEREAVSIVIATVFALGHRQTAELAGRSEEHTSELQSHHDLVCRLLLEKKKNNRHILGINGDRSCALYVDFHL